MVQEWLAAPATNSGPLLNSDPSKLRDRYCYFAPAEHPDSAPRPFLPITYTLPPDHRVASAILIWCDLSGISAGAVVQEAALHLALVQSDGNPEGSYTVTAYKGVGKHPDLTWATGYTAADPAADFGLLLNSDPSMPRDCHRGPLVRTADGSP